MRHWILLAVLCAAPAALAATPAPVIDMHLHAYPADAQGPPPVVVCAPYDEMPVRDPRWDAQTYAGSTFKQAHCRHPLWSAANDAQLQQQSLAMLTRYNIRAVTSGPAALVRRWQAAAPDRIIPALEFGGSDMPRIEALEALHQSGQLAVLGEITTQYDGIGPDDPKLEPYWAFAEQADIPVGIHVGPGPPGAAYLGLDKYRMRLSDPLALEDVLVRHPGLRLYVMHAGWPNIDAMIALLYAHPQVYVDTAVIDFTQPKAEFDRYLRRLVEAGYGKRILFGSDQMVWPGAIPAALAAINGAGFLTPQQKRDILYNNAARFLRLN